MTVPISGRIDATGALIAADPKLLSLQKRAGAVLGQPLAVPQLARVVAAATLAKQPIQRWILFGDNGRTVRALVDVSPDREGAQMSLSEWQSGPAQSAPSKLSISDLAPSSGWRWECNAELRLIALQGGGDAFRHPVEWVGTLMMEVFDLHSNVDGFFPLLVARQAERDFQDQNVSISGNDGHDMRLSGNARFDGTGTFSGYRGLAVPVKLDQLGQCPNFMMTAENPIELRFNKRVDSALRGPINRLIASAESISGQFDGPIKADYARYAGDIAHAGRHLLGLVDDLVDVQNIERLDFKVAADAIDLADLARRAAGLLAIKADEKNIGIHAPIEGEYMPATGEFRRVLQILLNLVNNAVRYSPESTQIWIRLTRDGPYSCVSVSDQGPGIDAVQHQALFEKFERLGRRDGGGSGLGLYIARRLAVAMDGDLTVESDAGAGSTFTLRLPSRG